MSVPECNNQIENRVAISISTNKPSLISKAIIPSNKKVKENILPLSKDSKALKKLPVFRSKKMSTKIGDEKDSIGHE